MDYYEQRSNTPSVYMCLKVRQKSDSSSTSHTQYFFFGLKFKLQWQRHIWTVNTRPSNYWNNRTHRLWSGFAPLGVILFCSSPTWLPGNLKPWPKNLLCQLNIFPIPLLLALLLLPLQTLKNTLPELEATFKLELTRSSNAPSKSTKTK